MEEALRLAKAKSREVRTTRSLANQGEINDRSFASRPNLVSCEPNGTGECGALSADDVLSDFIPKRA